MPKRDFKALVTALENSGHPFVVYRLPGAGEVKVLADDSAELRVVEDADAQRGFVFAPFASDRLPGVLLRAAGTVQFPSEDLPQVDLSVGRVLDAGDELSQREHYIRLVERAGNFIEEGSARKVVVSRRMDIPYGRIDTAGLFAGLARKYPGSMVYYFSHPQIGRWAGASPELLLLRREKEVRTMALAGTMPYLGEQMYRWDAKNVEEQAIVSIFVKDALEKSGVAAVSVSRPGNQSAGPVVHLCSRIEGQAAPGVKMNDLLRNLAPTPALCGYPRKEAMEFLLQNEGYSREFYGGYLGELNLEGTEEPSAQLYVNIRCLKIGQGVLSLYAGGGIVPGSDPQSEWEETCRKLDTLLPIIAAVSR